MKKSIKIILTLIILTIALCPFRAIALTNSNSILGRYNSFYIVAFFAILTICLIVSILICLSYKKKNKVKSEMLYQLPDNFNSLEIKFLYNGNIGAKDIFLLILDLANKGYIKITNISENSLFVTTQNYKLLKVKEYNGININEKTLLEGIFSNSSTEATASTLQNNEAFTKAVNKILKNINSKDNVSSIFKKDIVKERKSINFLLNINLIVYLIYLLLGYDNFIEVIVTGTLLSFQFIGAFMLKYFFLNKKILYPYEILVGAIFYFIGLIVILMFIDKTFINFLAIIFHNICFIGMCICMCNISNRTPFGEEMFAKIKGFKSFVEKSQTFQLQTLTTQNPNYFYQMLPYTYVFKKTDLWFNKFSSIPLSKPIWYDIADNFNIYDFKIFVDNFEKSIQAIMTLMSKTLASLWAKS